MAKRINFKVSDFTAKNFEGILADMRGSLNSVSNGEGYVYIAVNDEETITDENVTAIADVLGTLEAEGIINEDWGFEKLYDGSVEYYDRSKVLATLKTGESITLFAWNPEEDEVDYEVTTI